MARGNGVKNSQYKHGWTGTSLHNRWREFRARCRNPNHKSFHNYGGRGIYVAEEWHDFEEFVRWAGDNGYRADFELDRINNDGPYSPDNCRWVPAAVNARNRRDNRRYVFFGQPLVIEDAARLYGIPAQTITDRINRGVPPDKAVAA